MKTLEAVKKILAEHKDDLRARFGVRRIAVFGSYARGDQTPVSDVDVVVDLERPMGWEIVDLHDELERVLGIEVDLVTTGALKRKPLLWRRVQENIVYV